MHPHVVLGALEQQLAALAKRIEIQQQLGVIPHDLGPMKQQVEVQEMVELIVAVLKEHDASGSIADDLMRRLEARLAITA